MSKVSSLTCALFAAAAFSANARADQWKWHWKLNACSNQNDCRSTETCVNGTCSPIYKIVPMSDSSSGHPANITPERYEAMIHASFNRWISAAAACNSPLKVFPAGYVALDAGTIAKFPDTTYVQMPAAWEMGPMVLGYTPTFGADNNTTIISANVLMNPNAIWFDSDSPHDIMRGASFEQVLTHEIGHFFGLTHTSYPPTAIMQATSPAGIRNLTLSPQDIEDICGLYPRARPALGQGCSEPEQANDCAPTMACLASQSDGGRRICTTPCADESGSCSNPAYSCRRAGAGADAGKFACFLPPPPNDICKLCTTDSACQFGICSVNFYRESSVDAGICVTPCYKDEDCGPNERCSAANRFEKPTELVLNGYCQPLDYCRSYRCIGDAGCTGLDRCVEGLCLPPGNLGESCAATNTCGPGLTCTPSGTSKVCKPGAPSGCTCSTGTALTDLFWLPVAFLFVRRMRKQAKN